MPKKAKKIPMRRCVGCYANHPKSDMVRVVKDKENRVFLDRTGKANGRGAYLCPDAKCLELALKKKALERSLETPIDAKTIEELKEAIEEG